MKQNIGEYNAVVESPLENPLGSALNFSAKVRRSRFSRTNRRGSLVNVFVTGQTHATFRRNLAERGWILLCDTEPYVLLGTKRLGESEVVISKSWPKEHNMPNYFVVNLLFFS